MAPVIDTLLCLAADHPDRVLAHLTKLQGTDAAPEEASKLARTADSTGYTLIHAASSYGHLGLARSLVKDFGVDVNMTDEDGESAVFVAEKVDMLECLVDELGADLGLRNGDGLTVREKIEMEMGMDEAEGMEKVVEWLRKREGLGPLPLPVPESVDEGAQDGDGSAEGSSSGSTAQPPPAVNLPINLSLQPDVADDGQGDPELKQQLDRIVASGILDTPEGTNAVTEAIMQAVERAAPGMIDEDTVQRLVKKR